MKGEESRVKEKPLQRYFNSTVEGEIIEKFQTKIAAPQSLNFSKTQNTIIDTKFLLNSYFTRAARKPLQVGR